MREKLFSNCGKAICAIFVAAAFAADAETLPSDSGCPQPSADSSVHRSSAVAMPSQVHEIIVQCGSSSAVQDVRLGQGAASAPHEGNKLTWPFQVVDLVVRLTTGLAWPALVLTFMLLFRSQIAELIQRIKGAKWGDAGLLFADRVEAAEAKADLEPTPEAAQAIQQPSPAIASQDPRGVILSAWLQVEQSLQNLIQARGLAEGYTRIQKRPLTSIGLVQRAQLIDPKFVQLFHELRLLRNEAAHVQDFSPPLDSVVRYTNLAGELVAELQRRAVVNADG